NATENVAKHRRTERAGWLVVSAQSPRALPATALRPPSDVSRIAPGNGSAWCIRRFRLGGVGLREKISKTLLDFFVIRSQLPRSHERFGGLLRGFEFLPPLGQGDQRLNPPDVDATHRSPGPIKTEKLRF